MKLVIVRRKKQECLTQSGKFTKQEVAEEMEKSQKQGKMTERLGAIVLEMISKLLWCPRFYNYTQDFKDNARSYALKQIIKHGLKFDPSKGPTAYTWLVNCLYLAMCTSMASQSRKAKTEMKARRQVLDDALSEAQSTFGGSKAQSFIDKLEEQIEELEEMKELNDCT